MKFNHDIQKYKKENKSSITYYKYSLVFGIISIFLFILIGILEANGIQDNIVTSFMTLCASAAFINSFIALISWTSYITQINKLRSSKLFIENNELHYHLRRQRRTGVGSSRRETKQYVIKKINNYSISNKYIQISGEIYFTKDGIDKTPKIINSIIIDNYYLPLDKLIEYLNKNKL